MIAVILGLVAPAAVPTAASAHWWRTGVTGCTPGTTGNSADSVNHGYWYDSGVSAGMRTATDWSRANNLDPTDINTFSVAQPAFDTDVIVYEADYLVHCGYLWHGYPGTQGGVHGLAHCRSLTPNPAGACEKFNINYDSSRMAGATTTERRSLACHENGHTLGLEHSESCMDGGGFLVVTGYSLYQKAWINGMYN